MMAVLAGLVTAAGACSQESVEYDWDSGGDHLRDRSKKLFVGQRITDSLSAPNGDHTDWKEIRVRESGTLGVTVSIDNTSSMNGHIAVKDGYGVELERRPINASDNIYTFDRIPVYQGDYFVQVFVDRGDSVYTAGASFDPLPKSEVVRNYQEPADNGGGGGGGWTPKNGGGATGPGKTVVKAPDTPDTPEDQVETAPEDDQIVTLRGRIVRVIPQEDGGAVLTIVGVGRSDGLATGMTGTIIGFGKKFRVTSVSKRGALAVTQADAEDVKPYHNVVIKFAR
jgi:hypothetical protein